MVVNLTTRGRILKGWRVTATTAVATAALLASTVGCILVPDPVDASRGAHYARRYAGSGSSSTPTASVSVSSSAYASDSRYDTAAATSFEWLAESTGGVAYGAPTADEVPGIILRIIEEHLVGSGAVDVAFVIDTTGSMNDDIDAVKRAAHDVTEALTTGTDYARMGVVLYRDKGDEYVSRVELPFTDVPFEVHRVLDTIRVAGGGDLPEHVYAGLLSALDFLEWNPAARRVIILMGDAGPHNDYSDGLTAERVVSRAREEGIEISIFPIIVGR